MYAALGELSLGLFRSPSTLMLSYRRQESATATTSVLDIQSTRLEGQSGEHSPNSDQCFPSLMCATSSQAKLTGEVEELKSRAAERKLAAAAAAADLRDVPMDGLAISDLSPS